jgi:hypothetical protein
MSFEEKGTWFFLFVTIVVDGIYFAIVLGQVGETLVTEIEYIRPMIIAAVAMIVSMILGYILIAISKPSEADKKDERDSNINRRGEAFAYNVYAVATLLPLVLTMMEVEHFWIANAIFLAGGLGAIASSVVKLYGYRRGF